MKQDELRLRRAALETLWRQELSGLELLRHHSQLIDEHLLQSFDGSPQAKQNFALIALGGYGRQELFPFSDIDIMILYEPGREKSLSELSEIILYPLWDAGLEVGHSVRTVQACLEDAEKDFFFRVAMLDARFLAGSISLFQTLLTSFKTEFVEGRRKEFFRDMMVHVKERHDRFGNHSYLLEPSIKESRGGLRDIQTMLWVAQAVLGMKTVADIENAGLFTSEERQGVESAWDYLARLRNRLHYISGRKNDQLYFEHQEEIAQAMGYRSRDGLLGVEHFMRELHSHLQQVNMTSKLFLEHVEETIAYSPASLNESVLEPGIILHNGRIHLTDKAQLPQKPWLLINTFAQSALNNCPVHYWSRKNIAANLDLVNDSVRSSNHAVKSFLNILTKAKRPAAILNDMHDCGLLNSFVPEFSQVSALAQHDQYHVNTVDRHLIQTVGELKKLEDSEPFFAGVSKPHLLYLAALFHDIGKGSREDHSLAGAKIVQTIGKRFSLPDEDIEALVFLVKNHLMLMVTAQRRNLEDEDFLLKFCTEFDDSEKLTMLYLLSVADAKATGPTAWNDWKAALILELYLRLAHLVEHKESAKTDMDQGVEWLRIQLEELLSDKDKELVGDLSNEYLLSFTPEEIAKHIEWRKSLNKEQVFLSHTRLEGYWSVVIMSRDFTGLMSKICGTLALHNFHIVKAKINTWPDGTAIDEFEVRLDDFEFMEDDWQSLLDNLKRAVKNRLGLVYRLGRKYNPQRFAAKTRSMYRPPKVIIDNQVSSDYTVIEVYSDDQPGLLFEVTRTLADFGISISRAQIGSSKDQVVDVFYLQSDDGKKITDRDFQEEIRQSLLYVASLRETGSRNGRYAIEI